MPKPISHTLAMLQGGSFSEDCAEALATLVKGVDETGKAGSITITLALKKSGGAIEIAAKVVAKIPEPKADSDLLWATNEGNLVLDNPAQRKLALGEVGGKTKELATG